MSLNRRWGRRLSAALAAWLLALSALGPSVSLAGDLPACRYDDLPTKYQKYRDWQRTLLDTIYLLSADYAPPDLVRTSEAGLGDAHFVRRVMVDDLRAMADAAAGDGAPFVIQSAYRSYEGQVMTFNAWVAAVGEAQALLASARPGHSEHQLGMALDLRSPGGPAPWEVADWATTPAGAWLAANAWRFGFVMSYPKDRSPAVTCYKYEPWHYRYIGRTLAGQVRASGLTLREFLWEFLGNSTLTDPAASPTSEPTTATPEPSSSDTSSSTPSDASTASPSAAPPSSAAPSPAPDGGAGGVQDEALAVAALLVAGAAVLYGFRGGRRARSGR